MGNGPTTIRVPEYKEVIKDEEMQRVYDRIAKCYSLSEDTAKQMKDIYAWNKTIGDIVMAAIETANQSIYDMSNQVSFLDYPWARYKITDIAIEQRNEPNSIRELLEQNWYGIRLPFGFTNGLVVQFCYIAEEPCFDGYDASVIRVCDIWTHSRSGKKFHTMYIQI